MSSLEDIHELRNLYKINLQLIKSARSAKLEKILLESAGVPELILPEVREYKDECEGYWTLAVHAVQLMYTDINRFASYRTLVFEIQDKFNAVEQKVNAFQNKIVRETNKRVAALTRSCPMIKKEAFEMSVQELEEMIPELDKETKNAIDMATWFVNVKTEWDDMKGGLHAELNDCIERITALTQEIQLLISNVYIFYIPITISLYTVRII